MPTLNDLSLLEPELYPIHRLLIVGPLADAEAFARRADAAGHSVTLLIPDEELETAKTSYQLLQRGEPVAEDAADVVLELHCTDLEAKAEALLYLEDALSEQIPIITLALAISTGELVREMLIPDRVVGVSLLPPFEESRLAEIMETPHTDEQTRRTAERLFESIGLQTVRIADGPGGVLARTVCCLVNEAAHALQERIATAEDLDLALRLGANYPHGPLAWGDKIGLDRVLAVMEGLFAEYKEERYRTAPLLKNLVRAGYVGAKASTGFFGYQ